MFKCPVCRHATFNLYQYAVKSGVSTVQCSNCHTVLHQPPRLRSALAAIPIFFVTLPHHLGFDSAAFDAIWLCFIASLAIGIGVMVTRLEPVAPAGR